jgi:hypothetical protein
MFLGTGRNGRSHPKEKDGAGEGHRLDKGTLMEI